MRRVCMHAPNDALAIVFAPVALLTSHPAALLTHGTPCYLIIIPGGRFISSLGKLKGGRFIWLHVLGGGGRFISAQRHQKLSTANFLCFFERQIGRKNRKIETPLLSELSRSSLDSCELEGKVDQIQGRSA